MRFVLVKNIQLYSIGVTDYACCQLSTAIYIHFIYTYDIFNTLRNDFVKPWELSLDMFVMQN